ncbi:MAG TPA: hypothetical protein VLA48_03530 [Nitrososphaeraceae archaeon]|nr:hypothetical protein [Nitrososphaeraceae archaeon]
MKRYDVWGEKYDLEESENGDLIFYDDFVNFISARIKELEADKYIDSEHKRQRIKELKRLIA